MQKNLQGPLGELAAMDPEFPEIRVLVRTGDTPQRERAAMVRKPPHILVTTPESLYILLTAPRGRAMLSTVKTVIVDEIHALARDKRGSHLALSLERLEALVGTWASLSETRVSRLGETRPRDGAVSADRAVGDPKTAERSRPISRRRWRECELVDVGHRRPMDIAIEIPPSPLATVCSHEQWDEIYGQIAGLIDAHRTTLIFVNTRKMAERIAARLTEKLGEQHVTCHHSSLSKERRLDAEQRLKSGSLRALVATASLELGIDIGDVDLVVQVGATRSIATLLQRVGRSGHAIGKMPKGRLFPLTIDELIEAAALIRAIKRGDLDRTPQPAAPLDILAQQIVAECVAAGEQGWPEDDLFHAFRRAWPYRDLKREDFDAVIQMHLNGRRGLLHRDGVGRRIMARKRARITAITGGGAIPDVADYQVRQQPEDTFVGTLNEDFAIESNVGDIFQLGNTSWRILKVERGVVRVADAQGQPPSIPFWLGEGASRTAELSAEIADVREAYSDAASIANDLGLSPEAATQITEYLAEGRRVLGAVPTQRRVIAERFFDESGGMQLVLHAPFGGRINRAWGLALRKRFCRGFGFELQAAANEEAIVISLGLKHSFPLEDVFDYLSPNGARKTLTQAVLDQPMFESRWRWNATRSLMLERFQNGKAVPPQILRMRAGDLLAASFPAAVACPENLPPGDLEIPMDHPLVRQTIDDCLSEATDIEGLIDVLKGLRDGSIERVAIDTTEPSAFARGILNSELYTFLDDAPLEERRTQAVLNRRTIDPKMLDDLGALDPAAVERVRAEAWPQPESAEEMHDALTWLGFVTDEEAAAWSPWLAELMSQNRVVHRDGRYRAVDGPSDSKAILLGRLEGLGPVFEDDPRIALGQAHGQPSVGLTEVKSLLLELEKDGVILRTRLDGKTAWCERRLLARIHRATINALRREIEPVSAAEFLQFLACWQHVDEEYRLDGPRGVTEALAQLAGFEASARAWERHILPRRVRDYRREWLDEVTLSGQFAWGRLWRSAGARRQRHADRAGAARATGRLAIACRTAKLRRHVRHRRRPARRAAGRRSDVPSELAEGGEPGAGEASRWAWPISWLAVLSPAIRSRRMRQMITPPSRRRHAARAGRSLVLLPQRECPAEKNEDVIDMVARQLLRRTGVVFRRTLERERIPVTWSASAGRIAAWNSGAKFVAAASSPASPASNSPCLKRSKCSVASAAKARASRSQSRRLIRCISKGFSNRRPSRQASP